MGRRRAVGPAGEHGLTDRPDVRWRHGRDSRCDFDAFRQFAVTDYSAFVMAIYVGLRLQEQSDKFAKYSFGPDDEQNGRLRIDKRSGEIEILREVPGDETKRYSLRAARKMTLHFRKNEFPEVTCFAA